MDSLAPPPSLHRIESNLLEEARKPSRDTLRKTKVEIRLQDDDMTYKPGDSIRGELVIILPKVNSKTKGIFFNDVEILLENKVHTSFKDGRNSYSNFTMNDSPLLEEGHMNQAYHSYPFEFRLPEIQMDNLCSNNLEYHQRLIPSFGAPQLSAVSFGDKDVPGIKKVESETYDILMSQEDENFSDFTNYYMINCKVKQLVNGQKPFILFSRTKEVRVDIIPELLPPSFFSHTVDIDSVNTLAIDDIVQDDEELIVKSINLKENDRIKGGITISSSIPDKIENLKSIDIPIEFKYKPNNNRSFPTISYQFTLSQYLIQSSKCTPPLNSLEEFPKTSYINKKQNVIHKKLQTVFESDESVIDKNESSWIPAYNDRESYNKQFVLKVPNLEPYKNELLKPTFHSCHLQNIYSLHLVVKFRYDEVAAKEKKKWGLFSGRSKQQQQQQLQQQVEKRPLAISTSKGNELRLSIPIVMH
jgi:uncharacterized Zn finger protein